MVCGLPIISHNVLLYKVRKAFEVKAVAIVVVFLKGLIIYYRFEREEDSK
jgi:hypothetical protein